MLIIEELKEVKAFIIQLQKLNNLYYTNKSDADYSIRDGIFISYPVTDEGDLGIHVMENYLQETKAKLLLKEQFTHLNGNVDGKELYRFLADHKPDINKITMNEKYFILHTESEEYKSNEISDKDYNLNNYDDFISKDYFINRELDSEKEITLEEQEFIKSMTYPNYYIGENKIRMTKNEFLKLGKDIEINAKVFKYKDDILLLEIQHQKEKVFRSSVYYLFYNLNTNNK